MDDINQQAQDKVDASNEISLAKVKVMLAQKFE